MYFEPYIAKDRHIGDLHFDFIIADPVGRQWYDGSPEQFMPERQWCLDRLRPGMTAVDCGAHHGMMSVIFAKAIGPRGQVHAYEVSPENADVITRNAALNHLTNIHVRPVGVGAQSAAIGFNANQGNTVVLSEASPTQKTFKLVSLDEDLPSGVTVDFLKIDVEGFEAEALSGMPRILRTRPLIDLEVHNFLFPNRRRMLELIAGMLSGLGYRFTLLGDIWGQTVDMGYTIDVSLVAGFENPHIFCEVAR